MFNIICTVDRSMVASLLGKNIEHNVEMSTESNECVYSVDAKQLAMIDSWALCD
jgi:predicted ArsR family transcriptional regulator